MAESSPTAFSALNVARDIDPTPALRQRLYAALTLLAASCIEQGLTETAADILAFVLCRSDVNAALRDSAEDIFADLEGRICPRVIADARGLAAGMDLRTMIEYALDTLAEEPNLTLAQRPVGIA